MYVGRLLVVGAGIGAYRVSSRSFPDRQIVDRSAGTLAVVPTPEAAPTDNPYVAYNCLRTLDRRAVVGNGSHVDPIAEKIEIGYPPRDAVALGLLVLDYERDDYDTPRIAGVVGAQSATIGIVRREGLVVRSVEEPTLVATYERVEPAAIEFPAADAAAAAKAAYDLDFDHPVCAAGVTVGSGTVETAVHNGPEN